MISIISAVSLLYGATEFKHDYLTKELFTKDRLRFLPVPADFRNYFLLQSINDTTNVIIGDFVGAEKIVCLVMDEKSDETVDGVVEYLPDVKKYTAPQKPTSGFYTNLRDIKKQIIDGGIFRNTYSNKMNSLDLLKQRLERGRDVYRYGYGYSVKVYDPDKPSTIMSEFFFSKYEGRYDLIFATYYYRIFNTQIQPSVYFSVYCKNSKDPLVAETVESLLKMVPKQ
jgi:hypothetical protein